MLKNCLNLTIALTVHRPQTRMLVDATLFPERVLEYILCYLPDFYLLRFLPTLSASTIRASTLSASTAFIIPTTTLTAPTSPLL